MKPVIGISCNFESGPPRTGGKLWLNANYATVLADCGATPLLIPFQADAEQVVPLLDGLLIPGGPDIDPAEYGQPRHSTVTDLVPEERYELEKRLFEALPYDMPYLGICYGCQFLNVRLGGTLEQHVVDRVSHETDIHGDLQTYAIQPDSKLGILLGSQADGQSWHHQAVAQPGQGLAVVARNADGTIEAIEDPQAPFRVGVQWHPERTPNSKTTQELLAAFVKAAAEYRSRKKA